MCHGRVLVSGTRPRSGWPRRAHPRADGAFFVPGPFDDRHARRTDTGTSGSTAMSTTALPATPLRKAIRHELEAIRGKWVWLVALGVALIVLGTVMLGSPVVATL